MANPEHLAKLMEGVEAWNEWRDQNFNIYPDLKGVDLSGANLSKANLAFCDLQEALLNDVNLSEAELFRAWLSTAALNRANLSGAKLIAAHLDGANLHGAVLTKADLREANLSGVFGLRANFSQADLTGADLRFARFRSADFSGANLCQTSMIMTNFELANLTGCHVYGISAWDLNLEDTIQSNLVITREGESTIQVDNVEVAQFLYLLLNNDCIRQVIDTITSKVVLILGRFTPERKVVLDAIREQLRKCDYLPILFDFQKPESKSLTGTVSTLANMARFIIADLTDPSCIPYELATVIPHTKVVVQPVILEGKHEFAMFHDLLAYPWVLPVYRYETPETMLANLNERVIAPAEEKVKELRRGN
jgi:hypothetical protein